MRLSPHFTLEEMTRTGTGLPNTPTEEDIQRLRLLCVNVLEPLRAVFGPLTISSGYRSPQVSDAVGSGIRSQHRKGEAADLKPAAPGVTRDHLMGYLMASAIPSDQAIGYAATEHLHVSYCGTRAARRQFLFKDAEGYHPFP